MRILRLFAVCLLLDGVVLFIFGLVGYVHELLTEAAQ